MKQTRKLIGTLMALGALIAAPNQATAATWANTLADGDINNGSNWTGGLPSAGTGASVLSTTLVINQAFSNGNVAYLTTGTAGITIETGGAFGVVGATLLGSTIFSDGGPSTVTHTGGTLTLNNLIALGHHRVATYNISGGNLIAQGASSLDIVYTGAGGQPSNSAGSSLNISGTGQVDIETGKGFAINTGGTLNVTGGGLLIWHDRTLAEAAALGGTVNANASLVGSDVHFTAVPESSTTALLGLGGLALILRRRK